MCFLFNSEPEPETCEVETISGCISRIQAELFIDVSFGLGGIDLTEICGTFEQSIECVSSSSVECSSGLQLQIDTSISFLNSILEIPCTEPICRQSTAGLCRHDASALTVSFVTSRLCF